MILEINKVVEDDYIVNNRTDNVISHILDNKNIYNKFMSIKDIVFDMSKDNFERFVIDNCGIVLVCGINNGIVEYDKLNYDMIKNRLYGKYVGINDIDYNVKDLFKMFYNVSGFDDYIEMFLDKYRIVIDEDCEENNGGYWARVYDLSFSDDDYVDYFVIHFDNEYEMIKGVGKNIDLSFTNSLINVKYIVDYLKDLLYDRYVEVGKRFFKN